MIRQIGVINKRVIQLLELDIEENTPILLGDSNIAHMKSSHEEDYKDYGKYIEDILLSPDYVGINKKDNSIEYIKEFELNGNYVKVAVRVSTKGYYFARSVYTLNRHRVERFIEKNFLQKY